METLPTSPGVRDRADLTARRVRGRSIGRTEKAKAGGNSPDKPTSVWSEMARTYEEPLSTGKANDDRRQPVDASRRYSPGGQRVYGHMSRLPNRSTYGRGSLAREAVGQPTPGCWP